LLNFLKEEFDAYGFHFPKLSVRSAQLDESLEIMKKLWTEKKPSYKGEYYKIQEAICEPKPLQKPHPPITIGGGNEKFTLPIVSQHADRWDYASRFSIGKYKEKLEALKHCCEEIGRDFESIKKSTLFNLVGVYQTEEETEDAWKAIWKREGKRFYTTQSEYVPFKKWLALMEDTNLMGTPEECLQRIEDYLEIGVTGFELRFVDILKADVLEQFMKTVGKKIS